MLNCKIKTTSLVRLAFIAAFLTISHLSYAKSAGVVTFVTGSATITHVDKSSTVAAKNVELNSGDTIETLDGRLQLAFIDGGKVSLQPNTIYKINKYEFSGAEDGSEYGFTELVKGGLRTISGLIGHKNRDRYQLKTSVATIGIRGTEFTVNLSNNKLLMTTNNGSVDVCNLTGCLNALTGQSIEVSGAGNAPKYSQLAAVAMAASPVLVVAKTVFSSSDVLNNNAIPEVIALNIPAAIVDQNTLVPNGPALPNAPVLPNSPILTPVPNMPALPGAPIQVPIVNIPSPPTSPLNPVVVAPNAPALPVTNTLINGIGNASLIAASNGIGLNLANNPTTSLVVNDIYNAKLAFDATGNLTRVENLLPLVNLGQITFANLNNSDGVIAWGQSTAGNFQAGGNNFAISRSDYIAGAAPNQAMIANLSGTYNVFASTAPFTVVNGSSLTVGSVNSVTGNFGFNFISGTYNYNLTVPTLSDTFRLTGNGIGLNNVNPSFDSAGLITSTGLTCSSGCIGALNTGKVIQGAFYGVNAERVGLQYGINPIGLNSAIYGGAVLK